MNPSRQYVSSTIQIAFVISVGVILAITALAKLISAYGAAQILDTPDPLIPISYRQLLWAGVALESIILAILVLGTRIRTKLGAIAWLSAVFAVYRGGVWLTATSAFCPCLGTITGALRLSPKTADMIMLGILCYMLAGSLLLLLGSAEREKSAAKLSPSQGHALAQ